MDFKVTENSKRPASDENRCFYCHQNIGENHKEDCVLVKKDVEVDFTIRMKMKVPNFWDEYDIEFYYNESGWCASNILDEIDGINDIGCICPITEAKLVREISEEPYLHEK